MQEKEALRLQVIQHACQSKCMGHPGNAGGCCKLGSRDWIIGPVRDVDAFIERLSEHWGRPVLRTEVLIDYEEGRAMPDGPERNKMLQRMSELVTAYAPWNLHAYRYENVLVQPWLAGYKYNAFNRHPWAYYDVDSKRRKSASP